MLFYNTLTQSKEPFIPLNPEHVTMYVCGPTVYDNIHIGNARPIVVFDTLYRLLQHYFPKVTYVRNITDIDDKIITRAQERGITINQLTQETTQAFHEHIAPLNTLPPTVESPATAHIARMITFIETLIAKDVAYINQHHVLFRIQRWEKYGALSKRQMEEMIAGARVEVAPYKEHPGDFVLWKPSDDTQPGWDSPWGFGRPGWHIECSAISYDCLGERFDIHGGGQDLIFPHHENEIAQSQAIYGEDAFAQMWLHNGLVVVEGQKMSKSQGNFIALKEALAISHGEVLRAMLLGTHYRQTLDWSAANLEKAQKTMDRLYQACRNMPVDRPEDEEIEPSPFVMEALADDLNTPRAFTLLHEQADAIFKEEDWEKRTQLQWQLCASANMLGLLYDDIEDWFQGQQNEDSVLTAKAIEASIEARNAARQNRDFKRADAIREELLAQGIHLEDTAQGTQWRRQK